MNYLWSLFSLPSLPALPTGYLPSLPSLPQNLQRRFLSFVLKRSLGHLVKAGALDPERLEAQVVTGHVEVKGVELDEDVSRPLERWSAAVADCASYFRCPLPSPLSRRSTA